MVSIVTVNVSQTKAPRPATLQQSGALISQGATTTSVDTATLLTELADLNTILKGALANSGLTWAGNTATVTTAAPHGFTISDTIELTIAGVTPSGYNGTFLCTITGASTFTYSVANPGGASSIAGSYTPEDVAELVAMATTFFAQGSGVGVYVLELGAGNAADGVTALTAYIAANPNSNYTPGAAGYFYAYLVPRAWASEATFVTMVANFEAPDKKTYFFVTMTNSNYTSFTVAMKSVVGLIEAPTIPATEFSLAAAFYVLLNQKPSSTNQVPPFAFAFLFGVTAYPTKGNAALLATYKAAFVNVVGTGAEGGISNTLFLWGTAMDGHDFLYWYSVDWVQINSDIGLSNEVINGSNNRLAPLYYNQQGINRLQARQVQVMKSAITNGLALGQLVTTTLAAPDFAAAVAAGTYAGQVVVNADPFTSYSAENPNDYAIGQYNGIAVGYTPARGFTAIVFNVQVSDFAAA